MAEEDSGYEIMPYKEIINLKKQIEELKQKTGDTTYKDLLSSMSSLTNGMNGMLGLFRTAAEEMKLEEKETSMVSEKINPLFEKVDAIINQNRVIADGMVAIADMIKELKEGNELPVRKQNIPPQPMPQKMPTDLDEDLNMPPHLQGAPPGEISYPLPRSGNTPTQQRAVGQRSMPPPPGMSMPPPPGMSMPPPPRAMPLPPTGGPIGGSMPGNLDDLDMPDIPLDSPKKGLFSMFKKN